MHSLATSPRARASGVHRGRGAKDAPTADRDDPAQQVGGVDRRVGLQRASPRVRSRRSPGAHPDLDQAVGEQAPVPGKEHHVARPEIVDAAASDDEDVARGDRRLHAAAERAQTHRPGRLQRVRQQGRAGDVERRRGVSLHGVTNSC